MKKGHHPRAGKPSIAQAQDNNKSNQEFPWKSRSYGGFERPLIAVPFDWEDRPGVPKRLQQQQKSSAPPAPATASAEPDKDFKQWSCNRGVVVVQSLAPPPRLMMLSSLTRSSDKSTDHLYLGRSKKIKNSGSVVNSPRSPRSISLSGKMKSLLQGKLHSSPNKSKVNQVNSPPSWSHSNRRNPVEMEDDEYSGSISSNDIVFEGDLLRSSSRVSSPLGRSQPQQQQEPLSPFKNMSSLLLELWYGGNSGELPGSASSRSSAIPVGFEMISSSSSDLESPGSSTDNSLSSFSSDSLDNQRQVLIQVPRRDREMKTSFDSYDETSLNDDEELLAAAGAGAGAEVEEDSEDDFSIDFEFSSSSSTSSKEFFTQKFCYKSDRFRVEPCESASLISSKQIEQEEEQPAPPVVVQPLPSALKKENSSTRKCSKKVRFVFEQEEEPEPEEAEEEDGFCEPEPEIEPEISPVKTSPVLSRYSSRPASRFNEEELETDEVFCNPSPRTKRDLSQLFMQIIQADVELSQKHKGPGFKSMFRSRW